MLILCKIGRKTHLSESSIIASIELVSYGCLVKKAKKDRFATKNL